ncbi:MAG: type II toxin-antitoxin system RelE/ParE family toxin [Holosporaceae bacterium]|jgi:mRNA interferase RelE/StbE|nr:type II toxin-antitoxin system RelE/ParE family toxin [Holosporaceae bacterium]
MSYKIEISDMALKDLRKLDSTNRVKILKYMSGVLSKIEDPRLLGKSLTGNLGDFWRYRTGNFRIICKIYDEKLEILVIKIAHRKNAYL